MFKTIVKQYTNIIHEYDTMDFSVGAERETCSPPLYYSDRSERRIRKGKTKKKIVSFTDLPVQKPDYKLRKNKKKKNHNKIAKLREARWKSVTDELFSTEQHEQLEPRFKILGPVTQRWWIVKNDDDDISPYTCVSSRPVTVKTRALTGDHWIASDHWMNAML